MVCVCAGCWRISMANWPCCVPAGNGLRVSRAGKDIIWFHTVWCAQWHAEWLLLLWNHTTNIQRMKPREIYQRKQNIYVSYVFCDLKLWMCCILDSFQMHRMYPGLCNTDFNKSFFPTFNPTWTSGTSYYSDYFVLCLERCKLICCRQDLRWEWLKVLQMSHFPDIAEQSVVILRQTRCHSQTNNI